MTSSTAGTTVPALDSTLGALYIGIVLAMSLWGVASLQVFYYFTRFPKDDWRIKVLVVIVWILDSIHQGMITHAGYIYMVTQYGNIPYLSHVELSLEYMILISGITCLVVQLFLVYRVWTLSRGNKPLVVILLVIVIAAFCAITAYFGRRHVSILVYGIQGSTFSNVRSREWLGKMSESFVVASDFSIAGSLIFYLQRSRTGFKRTETTVNRLIVLTINTGLSTSVVAALTLIFISLYPNKYIYVACFVCISKLYVNSLLATLNYRRSQNETSSRETDNSQSIVMAGFRGGTRKQGDEGDLEERPRIVPLKINSHSTLDDNCSETAKYPMTNSREFKEVL